MKDKQLSGAFMAELDGLIVERNRRAWSSTGKNLRQCSDETRHDRKIIIHMVFRELAGMGYTLGSPRNLRRKHVKALARHWGAKNLSASTLHKRFSALRVFTGWIGKSDLVGELHDYYPQEQIRRRNVATTNRAWTRNGVDPEDIITKATAINERFGLYLALQKAFGLRVKESIELCPLRAVSPCGTRIIVSDGTKGGRPRVLDIETEEQRWVIQWARETVLGKKDGITKRLRWPDCTWMQARNRFYNLMKRLGVTRNQIGVTAHGLRHDYSQNEYRKHTGLPTPIEGGAKGQIERDTHKQACLHVSQKLGHGRIDVVGFYYGSYGHGLRQPVADAMKAAAMPT